jgi:hypothetical protein
VVAAKVEAAVAAGVLRAHRAAGTAVEAAGAKAVVERAAVPRAVARAVGLMVVAMVVVEIGRAVAKGCSLQDCSASVFSHCGHT